MNVLLSTLGGLLWGLAALGLLLAIVLLGQKILTALRQPPALADVPYDKPGTPALPSTKPADPPSPRLITSPTPRPPYPAAPAPRVTGQVAASDVWQPPVGYDEAVDMHSQLRRAAQQHDYAVIAHLSLQLAHDATGRPSDLALIAIAFYVLGDCSTAQAWVVKAIEAYQRQGSQIGAALERARDRCAGKRPQLQMTGGAGSGDRDVRNGELYYGFDDYPRAVAALERGLSMGGVRHPDVAYVYLGLAQLALKHYPESCNAFDQLELLPGVSRHIQKLWALFADMHCMDVESDP